MFCCTLLYVVVPQGCLRFLIVVFPDHTHLLFLELIKGTVTNKLCNLQEGRDT